MKNEENNVLLSPMCVSLFNSSVSFSTKEHKVTPQFTLAVIVGILLFFIIRAQNLFWFLRFLW